MKTGARLRERGQEQRDWACPSCSARVRSSRTSKRGELAVDEEDGLGPGRRKLLVVGDVLEIEAEILRREGLAVRPAMALAQREGEDAVVLDLDLLQEVRPQLQLLVIADEPRIGIDGDEPKIARLAHQAAQIPAVAADLAAPAFRSTTSGVFGRRSATGGNFPLSTRGASIGASWKLAGREGVASGPMTTKLVPRPPPRFPQPRERPRARHPGKAKRDDDCCRCQAASKRPFHETSSVRPFAPPAMRTKCPGPASTMSGLGPSPRMVNGIGQLDGRVTPSPAIFSKSSG